MDELGDLLAGMRLRMAEGVVIFDRPAAVRHLATATLRGVAGYCLGATRPDALAQYFKPGQGGSRPPAGLFQPLHDRAATADGFAFRIITWDPDGEFLPAMVDALARDGLGRQFGRGGARIAAVRFEPIHELVPEGVGEMPDGARLTLRTPLVLERQKQLVGVDALTLGHVVHATAWRLNLLSEHYGNGRKLDPLPWMAAASLVRERERRLEWVEPKRWSSSQRRPIDLAGVVGDMVLAALPSDLASLLVTAGVFHLAKHTMEGCGQVVLDPV